MDPNANLREQLDIAYKFVGCNHDGCDCLSQTSRIGELIMALDEWVRMGGYLPARWAVLPRRPR